MLSESDGQDYQSRGGAFVGQGGKISSVTYVISGIGTGRGGLTVADPGGGVFRLKRTPLSQQSKNGYDFVKSERVPGKIDEKNPPFVRVPDPPLLEWPRLPQYYV